MKDYARDVLDAALSTGGDFAEIFWEDNRSHTVQLLSGQVELINSNRLHGAGIRVFQGLNAVYAYTNDTDREGLLRCAAQVASAVTAQRKGNVRARSLATPDMPPPNVIRQWPSQTDTQRKLEYLRQADASARAVSPEIEQVSCTLSDSEQDVIIANSDGLYVEDTRVRTRLSCAAVASDGKEKQQGSDSPGALMGYELFSGRVDPSRVGREAAETARLMLHAPECPAGVMPVVIDNGFGGVIFHEACGHSLEATSVAFGMSVFCDKLGQQIAASCVTAVDDGTLPNEWGSLRVDDEGMPTTRLILIENGMLRNYMIDKLNAKRMGMEPTGSGRRQSYAFAPTSRMRNTYIAPGQDDEREMIATMGNGLYAKKLGGGSVDPATGGFNFAVAEGYLVKDGRIVSPVRGASLIGKGADVLMQIDRVGREMKMAQGLCGSISGSVPVNVGQPMIRVRRMTVGGRAEATL
ncbi:MAG TPA: TldD/PmbA family protein [Candidatus Limiplasma sp.]|mgnify:CR=1 FL=1|nr:TldD/PmbA family protein [Candidatus Limiplasma sp.]HPS82043.1 TldD/PmbA family protein [Candidatus Limiplasma sp.]